MTGSSARYEPLSRFFHISQSVGSKVVVAAGRTKDFSEQRTRQLSSVVEVLDTYSELWEQKEVTGDAPLSGTHENACASINDDLFFFGGRDDSGNLFSTLHKLDTKTWRWCQVHDGQLSPQGAPMPKCGCGMISFGDKLGVFGGEGIPGRPTEPGSFIRNTKYTNGRGWTNEFHIYLLREGNVVVCDIPLKISSI